MQISDFEKKLKKYGISDGGCFKKVDFQIHSPEDPEYEYTGKDALEQLGKTLNNQNYSFAVILEHQKFPSKELLKKINIFCPQTYLIPGAEINIFVNALGKDKKVVGNYYFHSIIAIDPDQTNDYNFILEKAKKDLRWKDNKQLSGYESDVIDVSKYFTSNGALFIPAHLHQTKSPQTSRSIDDIYADEDFLGFINKSTFSALEVRQKSTADFFTGDKKTQEGILIPKVTCIQSSDAHHHNHIIQRNRYTWIKTENNTFDELKAGLTFRDRVLLDNPTEKYNQIIGLHITGQFIQDQWINFNRSMNCLIGCKGSGKTSILECLRFIFGTYIPVDRKDTVNKHLDYILGASGYVECLIKRSDGSKAILIRRADSPTRLRVIEENDNSKEIDNMEDANFTTSILGWHEIEAVADSATARANLIDRSANEIKIQDLYKTIDTKIDLAREQLPLFQIKIKKLTDKISERQLLRDKKNKLEKLKNSNLLNLQNDYEKYIFCEQQINSISNQLVKITNDLNSTIESHFSGISDKFNTPTDYPKDLQNIIKTVKDQYQNIDKIKYKSKSDLTVKLNGIQKIVTENIIKINKALSEFRIKTYDKKVNALSQEDREILSKQIQIIEETKQLPDIENECLLIGNEMKQIAEIIYKLCEEVCLARNQICEIREKEVNKINKEIPNISLKFLRHSNNNKLESFKNKYGSEGAEILSFISKFGKQETYENLKKLFESFKNIDINTDIKEEELLYKTEFIDFLKIIDDDDIEISMMLSDKTPVQIQNLSAGQRCTAVFPLLLRINKGPLMIDQPEDNLDNRHIADFIAPQFLIKKHSQQFILTSHNANLVVLTDAELIIHVDSKGTKGEVVNRGFLSYSNSKIKSAVLDVLDGGENALLARQKKYGLAS